MTTDAITSEGLLARFNRGRRRLQRISILLAAYRDVMFNPVHAVGLRLARMARLASGNRHQQAGRNHYLQSGIA
jgi:hypothetical protein